MYVVPEQRSAGEHMGYIFAPESASEPASMREARPSYMTKAHG